jgi:hypothetical protein
MDTRVPVPTVLSPAPAGLARAIGAPSRTELSLMETGADTSSFAIDARLGERRGRSRP